MDPYTISTYSYPRTSPSTYRSTSQYSSRSSFSQHSSPSTSHKYLTPLLHTAITLSQTDTILTLLSSGASINGVTLQGLTPLETAIRSPGCRESIALLLIKRGADFTSRNNGASLLRWAARRDWGVVIDALIRGGVDVDGRSYIDGNDDADDDMRSEVSFRPIRSIKTGRANPRTGITPLHIAAYYSSLDAAKILISHGATLSLSSQSAELALAEAISNTCIPMVSLLLSSGIDLDAAVDKTGGTPLMAAVCMDCVGLVRCLLGFCFEGGKRRGRRILGRRDGNGEGVWHVGARFAGEEVVDLLRVWSADVGGDGVNVRNEDGESPLEVAIRLRRPLEVVEGLLRAGARRDEGVDRALQDVRGEVDFGIVDLLDQYDPRQGDNRHVYDEDSDGDDYEESVMSRDTVRQRLGHVSGIHDRRLTRYEHRPNQSSVSSSARRSSHSRSFNGSLSSASEWNQNHDRRIVRSEKRKGRATSAVSITVYGM
ncbi:hypothetical protein VTL71DRAFT_10833 [Oculimacula yallundae]|uniref:Ankyrin n=1 Tax=Oculimacula yallundae TaxID=86028 RepID=A0ABR4CUJ6_9HELO